MELTKYGSQTVTVVHSPKKWMKNRLRVERVLLNFEPNFCRGNTLSKKSYTSSVTSTTDIDVLRLGRLVVSLSQTVGQLRHSFS